jgi:hypothetical protein
MKTWLVYCPRCAGAFTGAVAPGNADFEKTVRCVQCNREIDANNGRFVVLKSKYKEEPVDLLKVG